MKEIVREDIIRAARELAKRVNESDYIVFGSAALSVSTKGIRTVDIDFGISQAYEPNEWVKVENELGKTSEFAKENEYYVEYWEQEYFLKNLPETWKERVTAIKEGEVKINILHPVDVCTLKLGAGRPKDYEHIEMCIANETVKVSDIAKIVNEQEDEKTKEMCMIRLDICESNNLYKKGNAYDATKKELSAANKLQGLFDQGEEQTAWSVAITGFRLNTLTSEESQRKAQEVLANFFAKNISTSVFLAEKNKLLKENEKSQEKKQGYHL